MGDAGSLGMVGDGWRRVADAMPPELALVEVHLRNGRVAYAQWDPRRRVWMTSPTFIRSEEVDAWRPAPRVR